MPRIMSDKQKDVERRVRNDVAKRKDVFVVHDVRKNVKRSKMSVRNAITKLEKEGVIVPVGRRPTGGKGRPMVVYQVCDDA